jgi:uncharacterized protein with NRDE domain
MAPATWDIDTANKKLHLDMCLLAIAFNQHPQVPLIITSNRDEFYARPTEPMRWWEDAPILAGRDQQAGGTWMGLSRNGRFAAVTNYRYVSTSAKTSGAIETKILSRGKLVTDFLCSALRAEDWVATLAPAMGEYDGFNLLIYDGTELMYINNYEEQSVRKLSSGVFALSNNTLDSPWPKVAHAREELETFVRCTPDIGETQLAELIATLSLQKTYAPELLPNTGVPAEWEELLSSPFIVADGYGTRASAAIILGSNGDIAVAETNYEAGKTLGSQTFCFNASER